MSDETMMTEMKKKKGPLLTGYYEMLHTINFFIGDELSSKLHQTFTHILTYHMTFEYSIKHSSLT